MTESQDFPAPGASDDDLSLALALADAADAISMARFGALDLAVETKPDDTPVSDADTATERAIRALLEARRPQRLGRRGGVRRRAAPARATGSSTRSTGPRTSSAAYRSGPR